MLRKAAAKVTAKLSHDDIRSALWNVLDQAYPYSDSGNGTMLWPSIVDVYDGFFIARLNGPQGWGIYRLSYSTEGDLLTLGTDPKFLSAYKGALGLTASGKVVSGTKAQELLAGLIDKNPLFAAIKDSPNTHFTVFDLTTVGRASQHSGKFKYRLATAGLGPALPTLISKPIHVTAGLDGHFDVDAPPKPIGTFLGGIGIDNDDETKTVRAVGTLWDEDFPDEVKELSELAADLGASYEIQYNALHASRVADDTIEISAYQFSGGALLKKSAAAHPETQLLIAKNRRRPFVLGGLDNQPTRQVRVGAGKNPCAAKNPGAAKNPQGGSVMSLANIPEELHAAVQALIDQAVASAKTTETVTDLQAEVDRLKAELTASMMELEAAKTEHAAAVAALEKQIADANVELAAAKADLAAKAEVAAKAELEATVEVEWGKLAAAHGFTAEQKAAKLPVLKKIVAGEKVTLEETAALHAGGKDAKVIPLFAGGGDGGAVAKPEDIARAFPAAAAARLR